MTFEEWWRTVDPYEFGDVTSGEVDLKSLAEAAWDKGQDQVVAVIERCHAERVDL